MIDSELDGASMAWVYEYASGDRSCRVSMGEHESVFLARYCPEGSPLLAAASRERSVPADELCEGVSRLLERLRSEGELLFALYRVSFAGPDADWSEATAAVMPVPFAGKRPLIESGAGICRLVSVEGPAIVNGEFQMQRTVQLLDLRDGRTIKLDDGRTLTAVSTPWRTRLVLELNELADLVCGAGSEPVRVRAVLKR